MSQNIDIATAKTSQLVAFYNAHAPAFGKREVVKFADRATAELRVTQLLADIAAQEPAAEEQVAPTYPVADLTQFHDIEGESHCPKCGSIEVFAGRNAEGVVTDEDTYIGCHSCDWEYDANAAAPDKPKASNADGVAASWQDPEVRAMRIARHKITVDGVAYDSVAAAFKALDLPMGKHIRFRGKLRDAGKLEFEGHKFALAS